MDELIKLVENLEKENDKEKQIALLQQIESKLLNEYNIVIEDTVIEPLRLEAYYYPLKIKVNLTILVHTNAPKKLTISGNYILLKKDMAIQELIYVYR